MQEFSLTRAAANDLESIEEYIAADNPGAAADVVQHFVDVMRKLSEFPGAGTPRDELYPRLRSFVVGNYILFYREIDSGIEVVRVLHAARDIESEFLP
jgi:toxin ParE1/3/4